MKFLLGLVVVIAIYYLMVRKSSQLPPEVPAAPTPASEVSAALKRPLDRTHDALEQVKKRNGQGEF
ncbi:MAG: hypothetical protein V4710_07325 [Verrucomicrobiota bacterium]